ncbi:hemicentin-1 [Plakobranchus ocellatus]|uniref:Hemicentin-1 n=1 Tax=Plakobranchus ocellatus TaxID=259542 RepID=A0AAV4CX42_9GAST|nr:hemicentin-1 [Plakobranchus ocellatus]
MASDDEYTRAAVPACGKLMVSADGNCMTNPEPLYERPVFKTNKTLFTFREGQTAVLLCSVENLEDKNVIWRLASDPSPLTVGTMGFSEDPRLSVEHDERGNWNLIIKDVTLKDAGVYECQVSSKIRHLRHHVTLMVTAAPEPDGPMRKKNIQITGKDFVDEGDPIKLVCKATSTEYPLEHIDWFRSGNTLTTDMSRGVNISMRYSVNAGSIESTLIIKKAKLEDRGHYTCRASNRDVIGKRVNVLKGTVLNSV